MKRETLRLPPGRRMRISSGQVVAWERKRYSVSRSNRYPVCDGPILDFELPEQVVARALELIAGKPWLRARTKHWDVNAAQWIAIREFVFERDDYLCVYCREVAEHADHLIPISKFGSWHPDNVVAACSSCNCSKNNMDLQDWLNRRFGIGQG